MYSDIITFENCFLNDNYKHYIKSKIINNDNCNFIFSGEYRSLLLDLFIKEYIKHTNINNSKSILLYNTIFNIPNTEYYNVFDDDVNNIKNKIIDFNNNNTSTYKNIVIIENFDIGLPNLHNLLLHIKYKCDKCYFILSCSFINNIKSDIINEFNVIESPKLLFQDYNKLLEEYIDTNIYKSLSNDFKKELYILSNANILTGMNYIDFLNQYKQSNNQLDINNTLNIVFNIPNINLMTHFVNNCIIKGTIKELQENINNYYYNKGIKINDFINYLWEIFWDKNDISSEQRTEVLRILSKFKFYSLKNFDSYNLLIRYLIKLKKVFI